jgi:hypothetical protein
MITAIDVLIALDAQSASTAADIIRRSPEDAVTNRVAGRQTSGNTCTTTTPMVDSQDRDCRPIKGRNHVCVVRTRRVSRDLPPTDLRPGDPLFRTFAPTRLAAPRIRLLGSEGLIEGTSQ